MTNIWARSIRAALDDDLQADPSPELWDRVRATLPARRPARWVRWAPKVAAVLAAVLVVSTSGLALAALAERFGWTLVERTPQPEPAATNPEMDTLMAITLDGIRKEMPEGMRLPTYLPESLTGKGVMIRRSMTDWSYSVYWHSPWERQPSERLIVQWHHAPFSEGSKTITVGPARDVLQVDINGAMGLAFQDDEKWQVDWEVDGYHYTVVTNISLDELLKVARSLK